MAVTMLVTRSLRRGNVYLVKDRFYIIIIRGKKSDGHLGCSRGYNSMEYKPHLPNGFYTQGREQVNSLLEKVSRSFNQMNYQRNLEFLHRCLS